MNSARHSSLFLLLLPIDCFGYKVGGKSIPLGSSAEEEDSVCVLDGTSRSLRSADFLFWPALDVGQINRPSSFKTRDDWPDGRPGRRGLDAGGNSSFFLKKKDLFHFLEENNCRPIDCFR